MPTLLVIDDNASVRETLSEWFTLGGYTVLEAKSGPEALSLMLHVRIDAAIVDVHMPRMDGTAVCRALRARAEASAQDLPVWLMTGARTAADAKSARDAGALAILGKPFDLGALAQQIHEQLQRSNRGQVAAS
ncbi:MAG: response regulator [Opitutaceae bacterium]|nr:response regulator [Opitutaceae bacterium]